MDVDLWWAVGEALSARSTQIPVAGCEGHAFDFVAQGYTLDFLLFGNELADELAGRGRDAIALTLSETVHKIVECGEVTLSLFHKGSVTTLGELYARRSGVVF